MNGSLLKTIVVDGVLGNHIDLSELSSGTYFMKIESKEGTVMKKIIIN